MAAPETPWARSVSNNPTCEWYINNIKKLHGILFTTKLHIPHTLYEVLKNSSLTEQPLVEQDNICYALHNIADKLGIQQTRVTFCWSQNMDKI